MPIDPTPEELARECIESPRLLAYDTRDNESLLRALQPLIQRCQQAEQERDALALAALAYDAAIQRCANDPAKMTSGQTAAGDDLDELYATWLSKAHAALSIQKASSEPDETSE